MCYELLTWQKLQMYQAKVQGHESWSQSVLLVVTSEITAWILLVVILIACNVTVSYGGVGDIVLLNFIHLLHYQQTFRGNIVWVQMRREERKKIELTALRQRRGTLDHFWGSSIHFMSSKPLQPNLIVLFDLCQVIPLCNFH
jgi:hypothetical protein